MGCFFCVFWVDGGVGLGVMGLGFIGVEFGLFVLIRVSKLVFRFVRLFVLLGCLFLLGLGNLWI